MANNIFKPYKVLSSKLNSLPIKAGQFIITTDTRLIYVDIDNSTRKCFTPTKLSELTNDAGFASSITETDPTVPAWAKASSKPTYTKSEVGLGNVDNTADANKSVKYAATAGDADTVNGLTVLTAVPANAKFTDTNTTYTFTNGLSANGTEISNSGVRSITSGSANGTISVNTNGTSANVSVKGLAGAAYKAVDTSISAASTSTNLPTSQAVAAFVEGKGYKTTDNNTTYTFATGDSNGQIKVTPSGGSAQNISVKGLGSLAYKSSLSASDVGALASSLKGAASGVAELDANGKVPTSQLPSYVDDVLEYSAKSGFPSTGETGKIYVDTSTNKTWRWGGSAYVEISPSLALGTTSSTAFRGDYGNTAYTHANAKGSAFTSGFYKITTNAQGHVTAATAVAKSDINNLGVPSIYVSSSQPSNMATGDIWFVTE